MELVEGGLSGFSLFTGLSPDDLAAIEARCAWHVFTAGQQVFDKESDTLEVYFVVTGALRILTGNGEREVALADVVAGNYFGELAAIDGMKRSARVIATMDSRLASLDGLAFIEVLHRHPEIGVRVLERLTRIIRNLDQRVTQLSTTGETQRVFGELVRLAQPDGGRPEGWVIPDMPNHKEIAAWVGTSREVVAQAIGELARDGVVKRRGMGLVIADWPRLQLMSRA
ncbi:MAG: Crp/Fnr family transcriptional regulator [Rhodospirillaceae bacterium]|nr:Crp/Fnr family transcriptional regulator [Rhodospirillales bacterium]